MPPEKPAETGERSLLSDEDLLDWIDHSARTFASIAADTDPETPIPACPGWTMADLLAHIAPWYSGWFRYNLQHSADDGDIVAAISSASPVPDPHAERLAYLRDAFDGFTSLARQIDLDEPVWTFWTAQPARFWVKRAATELAIHTWDAQDALGEPDRVAPDRAATSIDESLRGLWPGLIEVGRHGLSPDGGPTVPDEPAGFVATDTSHRWRVDPTADGLDVTTDDLPATVASGPAHDLLLDLWGRATGEAVETVGDVHTIWAWRVPS